MNSEARLNPAGRSFGVLAAMLFAAAGAHAQEEGDARRAYLGAVADFFNMSSTEVAILADWELPAAEIPTVLFIADRGGVSPEAVVALRRSGRSWGELASQYGVDAAALHVPIGDDAATGSLGSAFATFRTTPVDEWRGVRLSDQDIVSLVNVRVIAATLGRPVEEVVRRTDTSVTFVELFDQLRR